MLSKSHEATEIAFLLVSMCACCRLWSMARAVEWSARQWVSSKCIWPSSSSSFRMEQGAALYEKHGRRQRWTSSGPRRPGRRKLLLVNRSAVIWFKLRAVKKYNDYSSSLVTGTRRSNHISPVLRQLHWLPVRQCFDFKVANRTPVAVWHVTTVPWPLE